MNRKQLIFAWILVLSLLTAPVLAKEPKTARVKRVIDAQTLELTGGERVRLIGIDCAAVDTQEGKNAAQFVKGLVEGKEVRLEFDVQQRDKYGRLLAYVNILVCRGDCACYVVIANSTDPETLKRTEREHHCVDVGSIKWYDFINAAIIKAGYASPTSPERERGMTIPPRSGERAKRVEPNVKYVELFEKLYKEARENKLSSAKIQGEPSHLPKANGAKELGRENEKTKNRVYKISQEVILVYPIEVLWADYYLDGGTKGVRIKDKNGVIFEFCLDGRLMEKKPYHIYIGAVHPDSKTAQKIPIAGKIEREILSMLQDWNENNLSGPGVSQTINRKAIIDIMEVLKKRGKGE